MAVNLSTTTPAAPTGSVNVVFQTDGSGNVSGSVPASAVELVADNVDLTGQNANISATNIIASANQALYRVSAYIIVTTVDGTSSTLPSVAIGWTDNDNGQTQSFTLTPTNTGNTLTTFQEAVMILSSQAAAAITYATASYASHTPGTMKYALHIRLEQI
jgi:hypothetical protein